MLRHFRSSTLRPRIVGIGIGIGITAMPLRV
jgi:hypothetical protein